MPDIPSETPSTASTSGPRCGDGRLAAPADDVIAPGAPVDSTQRSSRVNPPGGGGPAAGSVGGPAEGMPDGGPADGDAGGPPDGIPAAALEGPGGCGEGSEAAGPAFPSGPCAATCASTAPSAA